MKAVSGGYADVNGINLYHEIYGPGWLNTHLSKSRLAIVPGYSHYNFISRLRCRRLSASSSPIR